MLKFIEEAQLISQVTLMNSPLFLNLGGRVEGTVNALQRVLSLVSGADSVTAMAVAGGGRGGLRDRFAPCCCSALALQGRTVLQMLQCFALYCRQFMEQHGEFSPVCVYMRDEVSQQVLLTVSFPSVPKK